MTVLIFIFQSVIKKKYGQDATNVGDEGGFAPNIQVTFSEQNVVILLKLFVAIFCLIFCYYAHCIKLGLCSG